MKLQLSTILISKLLSWRTILNYLCLFLRKSALTFTWRHPLPYDLMQAGRVLGEVTLLRACICGDQIIHTLFSAANQLMLNVPDLSRDFG